MLFVRIICWHRRERETEREGNPKRRRWTVILSNSYKDNIFFLSGILENTFNINARVKDTLPASISLSLNRNYCRCCEHCQIFPIYFLLAPPCYQKDNIMTSLYFIYIYISIDKGKLFAIIFLIHYCSEFYYSFEGNQD